MKTLFKTGLIVSTLALGTATFGYAQVVAPNGGGGQPQQQATEPAPAPAPAPAPEPAPAPAAQPAPAGTPAAAPAATPAADNKDGGGGVQEVHDADAITQLELVVKSQDSVVENQKVQIERLDSQLTALQKQLEAMTGVKNMSTLDAGKYDIEAAKSLKALADAAIAGGGAPARIEAAMKDYLEKFDVKDFEKLKKLKDSKKALSLTAVALASAGTAEDSYIRSNESSKRIAKYVEAIDKTPDVKASVDLNTRVLAEVIQSLNENLRAEAATTSVVSALVLTMATDEISGDEFLDFDKVNKK
jgi:Type IV secretion system proteins